MTLKKKSQTAIEAALLIGFLLIIFTFFVLVMNLRLDSIHDEKNLALLTSVGNMIKTEVDLAVITQDGYYRQFMLPPHLERNNYTVSLKNGSTLSANYSMLKIMFTEDAQAEGEKILFLTANINGRVVIGQNNITRNGGVVCLNTQSCP